MNERTLDCLHTESFLPPLRMRVAVIVFAVTLLRGESWRSLSSNFTTIPVTVLFIQFLLSQISVLLIVRVSGFLTSLTVSLPLPATPHSIIQDGCHSRWSLKTPSVIKAYSCCTFDSLSMPQVLSTAIEMSANPFSDFYATLESDSPVHEKKYDKNGTETDIFVETIPVLSLETTLLKGVPCSAFSDSSSSFNLRTPPPTSALSLTSPTSPHRDSEIEWNNTNLGTSPLIVSLLN